MSKIVPNEQFPFITCYARIIDRIDMVPQSEFKDALIHENKWNLGKIKYMGGLSQYIIEFDIWNNEPDVSAGFTQKIFNDAKDCSVSIVNRNKDNNGMIFKIRNVTNNYNDEFINAYDNFPISGNVTKVPGILKGNGDHCMFQIAVDLINRADGVDMLPFTVCFCYNDSNTDVKLEFECCIEIEHNNLPVKHQIITNNGKVFVGNIANMNCPGAIIEAYSNGKLKDQLILKDDKYYMFLTDDNYTFIIKNSRVNRRFPNVVVNNGITENYLKSINGLIRKQYNDVIEYYDELYTSWEIYGQLIDEYGSPISNAEIIITQGENLIVYYITDSNGKYRFKLPHGIYDIRIRSSNKRLKIIKDFEFRKGFGFFSEIKQLNRSFDYDFGFKNL